MLCFCFILVSGLRNLLHVFLRLRRPTGACHAADATRSFVYEGTVVNESVIRPPRDKRNEDKVLSLCVVIEARLEKGQFKDLLSAAHERR